MEKNNRNSSLQQAVMYVAGAKAILKNDETGMATSDTLGIFLVTPIKDDVTGEIIGYREARTQKRVIVSKKYAIKLPNDEIKIRTRNLDIISQKNEVGGIKWEVFTKVNASELMGMKDVAQYFYKEEDEIINRLVYVRERAEGLAKDFQNKPCKETRKETQKQKIVNQRPTYIAKQA